MLDKAAFTELTGGREQVSWRQLFNKIDGFGPTLAKEVVARATDVGLWGCLSAGYCLFRF